MILGVDHIALSTNTLSDGIAVLESCGYQTKFIQRDVPNPPSKKEMMRSYQDLHSVAYCQVQGGVSIELTEHATAPHDVPTDSPYQVLLSGLPAKAEISAGSSFKNWQPVWNDSLPETEVMECCWNPFGTRLWAADAGFAEPPKILGVLLPVGDLSAATDFWCNALGCRRLSDGHLPDGSVWQKIGFRSPVKSWCLDLLLVQSEDTTLSYIDDRGFPCLALISKRLSEDITSLKQFGVREMTDVFQLEMNSRTLNIIIFRGLGGELIELIEIT